MATGDPIHGPVSAEIIGQMECCDECVKIRSRKPFMSAVFERDYTPYEMATLHVIYHHVDQPGVGNVFIAPAGTQPGEPGWKYVGYLDRFYADQYVDTAWAAYKGPPAGRDRFA